MILKYCQTSVNKVFVITLRQGEDLVEFVRVFCEKMEIEAGTVVSGIGALSKCSLGYFDRQTSEYLTNVIEIPVELVSCAGTIALAEDEVFPHIHVIVANSKGECFGGHAMTGCIVGVIAELVIVALDLPLNRKLDPDTGLLLLDPSYRKT